MMQNAERCEIRAIIRSMLAGERMEIRGWTPPWLRHQHEARYDWARQYCNRQSVLDAACGTGYGSRRLATVAARVISLDIAADAVAAARRTSPETKAVLGDATRLPFPDASFGLFVSLETIEHVADDVAYVREARRIVRPGGTFICSTPNRLLVNPGNSIADIPFNPYHVREYSAAELESLLLTAFGSLEMIGQTPYSSGYVRLLGRIGRRSKMAGVRVHQLRKLAGMPFERRSRHEPFRPGPGEEPEVLLAICR